MARFSHGAGVRGSLSMGRDERAGIRSACHLSDVLCSNRDCCALRLYGRLAWDGMLSVRCFGNYVPVESRSRRIG